MCVIAQPLAFEDKEHFDRCWRAVSDLFDPFVQPVRFHHRSFDRKVSQRVKVFQKKLKMHHLNQQVSFRAQVRLEEAQNLQTRSAVGYLLQGLVAVAGEPEMTAAAQPAEVYLHAELQIAVAEKEIAAAALARESRVEA